MTTIDKTSPNAVAVRGIIYDRAASVYLAAGNLERTLQWLTHEANKGSHLIDGDREQIEELITDLEAAEAAVARIKSKAALISRRTKNESVAK